MYIKITLPCVLAFILLCIRQWDIKANLSFATGNVFILKGEETIKAYVGASVLTNNSVRVSEKSFARISVTGYMGDKADFILYPGARVVFKRMKEVHKEGYVVEVELISGEMRVDSNDVLCKISFGNFHTHFENGILRARKVDDKAYLEVLSGSLNLDGKILRPGFGVELKSKVLRKLPEPPSLLIPQDGDELHSFFFLWRNVLDSTGYVFEIAMDSKFKDILLFSFVERNDLRPDFVKISYFSGNLYWRVWAISEDGFGGIPSEPRKVFVPRMLTQ